MIYNILIGIEVLNFKNKKWVYWNLLASLVLWFVTGYLDEYLSLGESDRDTGLEYLWIYIIMMIIPLAIYKKNYFDILLPFFAYFTVYLRVAIFLTFLHLIYFLFEITELMITKKSIYVKAVEDSVGIYAIDVFFIFHASNILFRYYKKMGTHKDENI